MDNVIHVHNSLLRVNHVMDPPSAPMTRYVVSTKRNIFKKSYDNRTYTFLKDIIAFRGGTESIGMYTNGTQEKNSLVN